VHELPVELEIDTEQLASNSRRSAVVSIRDRRARTGVILRLTMAGLDRLASELAALKDEPGHDRRVFTLAVDLEVAG
jgi:hypothetical protein